MPVTPQSVGLMAYRVGGINVPGSLNAPVPVAVPPYAGPVKHRGIHTVYPTDSARFNQTIDPPVVGDARAAIKGTRNNLGNAIFLKYFDNEITSVRLPFPAPAGVTLFVTDNLSGCKFYVDSIAGSNDVIVYHANTHQHTAGPASDADFQQPAANGVLDAMHTAGQGDYAGLVLNNVAECALPRYFNEAGDLERAKRARGRTGPKFMGGCTIVGFPGAAEWEFYYQTWGDMNYSRPSGVMTVAKSLVTFHWNHLRKLAFEGANHRASFATMRVVDHGRI